MELETTPRGLVQSDDANAARQSRRLTDLLTRVSEVLAQGTDTAALLRDVARALVPAHAAACVFERVDTAVALREVLCTQHESPALGEGLRAWACQPGWFTQVIAEVVDSGKPRLLELRDNPDATARALGFDSVLVVPMIARRRLFGVLTCAPGASRGYDPSHVDAFADLAHRVALGLDNAELFSSAQQTRRDQDDLLGALSTEVAEPLAAMADAARNAGGENLAEYFLSETLRMQARLRELIDFNRLLAGQLQLRTQNVDMADLLSRAVDKAQKRDARSRVTKHCDADVANLQVRADPERLAEAFDTLLGTALSNTSDDAQLDVLLSRVDSDVHVTFSGTGAELIAGVTELTPYSYDSASAASGARPATGLRLAHALIELQGGRLWLGASDVFYISLPLCAADHARTHTEQPSPETVILLVDSDLAFRRELQELLSERGYKVETADNGLQAWQYLLGHSPPALILFDLVLPAMDGWELHAAIRSHAALQGVPTVVVSGLDRYRIEASLPDAHGYIEKPIRSAQLFEMVQRHVVNPARPRTMSVRPSSCF